MALGNCVADPSFMRSFSCLKGKVLNGDIKNWVHNFPLSMILSLPFLSIWFTPPWVVPFWKQFLRGRFQS